MDAVMDKKYTLASKSMKLFQFFIVCFLIISFQFSLNTWDYAAFLIISIGITAAANSLFMAFIAKYAQGEQKTYSKKYIRDTLIFGVIDAVIGLLMMYNVFF